MSLWLGTSLVAAGVLMNAISAVHHARLVRELNRGQSPPARPSTQAVVVALFLALVGVAMAVYLISLQRSRNRADHTSENSVEGIMTSTSAMTTGGIVSRASNHSVDETVDRIESILQAQGITLFALVDHSGEAEKAGIKMPPTKLLIFGNPKAGAPLILATPSMAIDLPLKILVAEDAGGNVWISYNSADYLEQRHRLPADLAKNIAVVDGLAAKAAE